MLRGIRSFNEGTLPLRVARSGTKRPKYGRLVPTAPQHLLINLRIPRNRRRLLVRFACSAFSVLMRFVGNGFLVSMRFCLQRLLGIDAFCRQLSYVSYILYIPIILTLHFYFKADNDLYFGRY